jgi:hypothetical protein
MGEAQPWGAVVFLLLIGAYGAFRIVSSDPPVRSWRGALAVVATGVCLVAAVALLVVLLRA